MEVKLKLCEVINLNNTLKEIIDNNKELDALFKFRLLSIMKAIEAHVLNFETVRNDNIIKYGKKGTDGTVRIVPEDKDAVDKFNESLREVIDNEVTINIEKLKAEDVFSKDFDTDDLMRLYPIIKE